MNIENHVENTLADFQKIGILEEILFIGAWARYFYKNYFSTKANYFPRLATKDLDILLQEKSKRQKLIVDIHQKLIEQGYEKQFFRSGIIKYYKNELELEFLLPTNGEKRIVEVKAFNLKAQELPYLAMLWNMPIEIKYGKYKAQVPNPLDYAIHKLIIAQSRSAKETRLQDIRDAEDVLAALKIEKNLDRQLKIKSKKFNLNKKTRTKIQKSLREFLDPRLRESLTTGISVLVRTT